MRTVSSGFGGVIVATAMIVSFAYALGEGNSLANLAIGFVQQVAATTDGAIHEALRAVSAQL